MATPHISGIAGLLLAENPNLYNDDIEHIIRLSAEDIDDSDPTTGPGFDEGTGTGRVNALKALEYLQSPYTVKHWTAQGGTSVESWSFNGTFYDLPGAPDGDYVGTTHRVHTTVNFPESFSSVEDVWSRGVASTGYSAATTNFSIPYCRAVSHTATSVTLETFVHDVSRIDGSYAGWYPVKPANIECAYTVLGEPAVDVTISGPSSLNSGESGTWTANTSGGESPFSYQWYEKYDADNSFSPIGGATSSSYSSSYQGNVTLKAEVTAANSSDSDTHYVSVDCEQFCVESFQEAERLRNPSPGPAAPDTFALHASRPNPVRSTGTVQVDVPESAQVRISVYDVMGRRVAQLVDRRLAPGRHPIQLESATWPSGVYFVRMRAGSFVKTQRVSVVR